jgi:hypothetical protein
MSYDEEYEEQQQEAEFLEYDAAMRRMYERGEAMGYARGRAERLVECYQQEPLVVVPNVNLETIDTPF